MDQHSRCNTIHYCSSKSKRIARSALTAELFVVVNGFDHSSTMRLAPHDIFGEHVPLKLFTDSKSLYDGIVGINSTSGKRLPIDLRLLRQPYKCRKIAEVLWITSAASLADALTKENAKQSPQMILRCNKLDLHPNI